MIVLHIQNTSGFIVRGVMGCKAWADKIAPVLVGMGFGVRVEAVKIHDVPPREDFERKQAEAIINKAYALLDNLFDTTN